MSIHFGSTKDISTFIREITWHFGSRGLKGECCGDLSQPEYRALCMASEKSKGAMRMVAKSLGFTMSGASRVIDRLEKMGYAKRKRIPEDGRVCCIEVTPSGQTLIKNLSQEYDNRIDKIMSKIDPAMQEIIGTALRSFVKMIKQED